MGTRKYIKSDISDAGFALINKIITFDREYPGNLEPDMLDWLDMLPPSQEKHNGTWKLNEGNNTMNKDAQQASLSRHTAKMLYGARLWDDSGFPHSYHIICRATMQMIRDKRGLVHEKDLPRGSNVLGTIDDSGCVTMEEHFHNMKIKKSPYYKEES